MLVTPLFRVGIFITVIYSIHLLELREHQVRGFLKVVNPNRVPGPVGALCKVLRASADLLSGILTRTSLKSP